MSLKSSLAAADTSDMLLMLLLQTRIRLFVANVAPEGISSLISGGDVTLDFYLQQRSDRLPLLWVLQSWR